MSKTKVQAIIGIGIPGCGKTTLLKPMARRLKYTYINRDDIREELTGDSANHTKERLVNKLMFEHIAVSLRVESVW